jgi:pimeloyl-ACP methyl ester carboxylesterase
MKLLLNILAALVVFLIAFSLWGFYWAIRPLRITSSITPTTFGVAYENISFRTKDHVLLKGWYIPSPNPRAKTIILLHGYPADKGNILPSRMFLHSDYNLLLFDFRYFGDSEGNYSTAGKNEVLDLLAAIDYLKYRGIDKVYVWGFSLGGAVALMAAEKTSAIQSVIAESSYARLDWMAYEYYPFPLLRYPLGELTRFWAWLFLNINTKKYRLYQLQEN